MTTQTPIQNVIDVIVKQDRSVIEEFTSRAMREYIATGTVDFVKHKKDLEIHLRKISHNAKSNIDSIEITEIPECWEGLL